MSRFYACRVIGAGTEDDPYRPAIAGTAGVKRWTACIDNIARGQVSAGTPRLNWTVLWVDATNWTAIEANTAFIRLPALVDLSISPVVKTRLRTLGALTTTEAATLTEPRQLLRLLVRKHYSYADEDSLG